MSKFRFRQMAWSLFSGLGIFHSVVSYAVLGEIFQPSAKSQSSIFSAKDRNQDISNPANGSYSIHKSTIEFTELREYVSSDGIVFGVAWNGYRHPNLDEILGSYLEEYQGNLKITQKERGRRNHSVQGNRIVVQKWGHMRNLQGRAYDPSLLPSGVSADEIQ